MYPGKKSTNPSSQVLVYDSSTGKIRYTSTLGPVDSSTGVPLGIVKASNFQVVTGTPTSQITSGAGVPSTTVGTGAVYLRTDGTAKTAIYCQIRSASSIGQSTSDYTSPRATSRWGDPVRAGYVFNISMSGSGGTVDGVTVLGTQRVLAANQTTTTESGIFTVGAGNWIRAKDANSASTRVLGSKVGSGSITYVSEGTFTGRRFLFIANSDPLDGNGVADLGEIGGGTVSLRYSEWITARSFENYFSMKQPVRTVARTNISLSGLGVVGGVQLLANDRVLVVGQTTASQNGIYVAASGSWTRSTDANLPGNLTYMCVYVSEGWDTGAFFYLTTLPFITVGSTSLTYVQLGTFTPNVTNITTDYTVLNTDCTIAVGAIVTPITVTLPSAPYLGQTLYIKDVTGVAASQNITVSGNGSTIDGASSNVIGTNFGKLVLMYTGTQWSIIN